METGQLLITEWLMIAVFIGGVTAWGFRMAKKASRSLDDAFMADRKALPDFF